MLYPTWLCRLRAHLANPLARRRLRRHQGKPMSRPLLEVLEDRCVPSGSHLAFVTATTTDSSGSLSGWTVVEDGQPIGGPYPSMRGPLLQFTPDGNHLAYVAPASADDSDNATSWTVVKDGQTVGGPYVGVTANGNYSSVLTDSVLVSAHGDHVAFAAATNTDSNGNPTSWVVVEDGQTVGGPYPSIFAPALYFSRDGSHLAYTAADSADDSDNPTSYVVVEDGQTIGGPYAQVAVSSGGSIFTSFTQMFSPDSQHVAFAVATSTDSDGLPTDWQVIEDGQAVGGPYPSEQAPALQFSPDSSHLAYIAPDSADSSGQPTSYVVVEDGQTIGAPYAAVGNTYQSASAYNLMFSSDSNHLTFTAATSTDSNGAPTDWVVVEDGQSIGGPFADAQYAPFIEFSQAGDHLAYVAQTGTDTDGNPTYEVFEDGQLVGGPYAGYAQPAPQFSPDGNHLAYAAQTGTDSNGNPIFVVVEDGQTVGGPYSPSTGYLGGVLFPNSSHLYYTVATGTDSANSDLTDWEVIEDGSVIGGPYAAQQQPTVAFSPDGNHLAYATQNGVDSHGNPIWQVVEDGQAVGGAFTGIAGSNPGYFGPAFPVLSFSPDGNHFAFAGATGLDGNNNPTDFEFIEDGQVVGGPYTQVAGPFSFVYYFSRQQYFSPDSAHLAYTAATSTDSSGHPTDWHVVEDGQVVGGPYSSQPSVQFSPTLSSQPSGPTITRYTNPINGTNDTHAAVSGSADASDSLSVAISDGTNTITETTTADATTGAWSISGIDLSTLADGNITYTMTATDGSGKQTTDTVHATKKTSTTVALTDETNPVTADNVTSVSASGTADAGDRVRLTISDGTNIVTQTTTAFNGTWAFDGIDLSALNDGKITYTATATDFYGNSATVSVTATLATQGAPTLHSTASGDVTLDGSGTQVLTDTAVLSNGINETGTITFTLTAPDGSIADTETVDVNGDDTYSTPNGYTLPATGALTGVYTWSASYSGDDVNSGADDQGGSAEQTLVSSASLASPTLVTTASADVTLDNTGAPTLTDSAVLAGGNGETGSITFTLTRPDGTVVDTESATIDGDGTYATPTGYTLPTSGTVASTYTWSAVYSGDQNNNAARDQGDSAEQTAVNPASPTLVSTASPGPVTLGSGAAQTLTDSAVLAGGYAETGQIVFTLTAPGGTVVDTESVAVAGDGTYATPTGYRLSASSAAGTYTWSAVYNGDGSDLNNNLANDQADSAEQTVVRKMASSTLVTTASAAVTLGNSGAPTLTDSAVLAGGMSPTGKITFTLTGPGSFSYSQSDTVSGNGTYTASTTLPTTGTVAGTYTWTAKYAGDSNNTAANDQAGSAEQTIVSAAAPTLSGTAGSAVTLGSAAATLTDSAVLSGGYGETGSITFTLVAPGGTVVDTESVTVTGNGTYPTPTGYTLPTSGTVVGTYTWTARYSGDANNSAARDQGGTAQQTIVGSAAPTLTANAGLAAPGSDASPTLTDSTVLSGSYAATGTITFTLAAPGGNTVDTESVAVHGNGTYSTPAGYTVPITGAAGTYSWTARYSGDTNNNPANDQGGSADQVVVPALSAAASTTAITLGSSTILPLKDIAVLLGATNPTGKITFVLTGPSGPVDHEAVTVKGNGTYTTPTGYKLPTTGTVVGTYTWSATYSGDTKNHGATVAGGSAQQSVIGAVTPTLTTTASPAVSLGTSVPTLADSAVLAGGYHETGKLVFTLTGPGGFSYTRTDTVNGNGTYKASTKLPATGTLVGTYTWSVHYRGDTNNSAASDQGGTAEQTAVGKANLSIVATAKPTETDLVATTAPSLSDSVVLAGGYNPTGTLTFTLHQGDFTGPAVYSTTVTVKGNRAYSASTASESGPGPYSWTVTYSGDTYNAASAGQQNTAKQVTIADAVARGEAAATTFWAGTKGQALLGTYDAALGNWLGTGSALTNLFGNLDGATGTQVAHYLLTARKSTTAAGKLYADALATALNVWATTSGLGWNTTTTGPKANGLQQGFGGLGLGAIFANVGTSGAAFGVSNKSLQTVDDLLAALNANTAATGGSGTTLPAFVFYGNSTKLENEADSVFTGID